MPATDGPYKRYLKPQKKAKLYEGKLKKKSKKHFYSDFLETRRGVNPKEKGFVRQNQNFDPVNRYQQKYKNQKS